MTLADSSEAGIGWRSVLLEMLSGVRAAIFRFPVPTIFLAVATLQANLLIADIYLFRDVAEPAGTPEPDLVLAIMSGAVAALAAVLSGEARGHTRIARNVAAIAAGLVAFVLLAMPERLLVLEWTLVAGLAGLVLVAPFLGRGGSGDFWMFSARTAFAILLGLLALLLLAGGISAILASLTYLFRLPVPERLYEHVWATTGLFAAPLFGLGQLPERFDEQPGQVARGFMERGMRALGDFLAAPLLIVYAIILHLYALKIAITGEVPEGQIGWLVLTYGFCVFGVLLIINSFFDRARAPTRFFLRFWPFFLPVPLVLLFYALVQRVGEFGVTPERFLLGLFGLVTALVLLLQLSPRLRGDIRLVAAVPVIALILGSFGPQGALGVSLDSQADRFLGIVGNPPVEGKRHEEALAALSFLSSYNALSRVAAEGTAASNVKEKGYDAVARAWGLDPQRPTMGLHYYSIPSDGAQPLVFGVEGFDVVVDNVVLATGATTPVPVRLPAGGELALTLDPDSLIVTIGENSVRFSIPADEITRLARLDGTDRLTGIPLDAEGRRITLVPTYFYADLSAPPGLKNLTTHILLRSEDWNER